MFEAPNDYMVTRSIATDTKESKKPEKYTFDSVDEIKNLMVQLGAMINNIQNDTKRVPLCKTLIDGMERWVKKI